MNRNDRDSVKTSEEMSSTTAAPPVPRGDAGKQPKSDSGSLALYIKLHEARRAHDICRHLLGRAYLL